ncbi:MAG: BrnT family toxin [Fidelibacterota bacterium]|nr:MAG: BrnT family toxin [Candidatus Neomarinimicrobiota bacterium]
MDFEFDLERNISNKLKRGIDFIEAQALWSDPDLVEIPVRTIDEPRFLVIGKIGSTHWSGIIAYRDGNIRIISMRRSLLEEVEIYES